ncbi:FAD:protein FMN transferase [Salipiger sp. 1_MG-2023]|uniref:FAD:protein FMN transferase n=1 Tax=Salipiger sp. 1_MG-2023 TaxID=3062665 RepID=UPI0026E23383|nr:FAD:protein FMN transferase [Salipiger sp. 1_MG-2023]MDO6585420.1 FAD:protein FMN transferase [Salipiger sp. 1_MG-2023]
MMLSRRRFLSISAAALSMGASAAPARWSGLALGAEAQITLHGPGATEALPRAIARLRQIEAAFSLYDPDSEVSRLNRAGRLVPSQDFAALMALADRVHRATQGQFDPTVQPLWQALARGQDSGDARQLIGWETVQRAPQVVLSKGQALTFNGIAQGYATDAVVDLLETRGFGSALVNIGEFRALGGPWRLGLADPDQGLLGSRTLTGGAVASSSPSALMLGAQAHILSPQGGAALWSTVSVECPSAALADALSTGFCLMDEAAIRAAIRHIPARVTLVDAGGNLRRLPA